MGVETFFENTGLNILILVVVVLWPMADATFDNGNKERSKVMRIVEHIAMFAILDYSIRFDVNIFRMLLGAFPLRCILHDIVYNTTRNPKLGFFYAGTRSGIYSAIMKPLKAKKWPYIAYLTILFILWNVIQIKWAAIS